MERIVLCIAAALLGIITTELIMLDKKKLEIGEYKKLANKITKYSKIYFVVIFLSIPILNLVLSQIFYQLLTCLFVIGVEFLYSACKLFSKVVTLEDIKDES